MKIVEWVHVEGIHREICSNRYFGVVCMSASDVLFWTYRCFFELLFFLFFFRNRCHHNRHKNDDWRANTVVNIVYCPVKNLKKKKKKGGEVERARFRKRWTKRIRGKAVSNTKMVPLNLKCDSNWKRYVTLRTICIEWFRLPAENTETGHAVFKTRSSS